MKFESSLLNVRLALVECKTLLNNWDKVATAACTLSDVQLQPIDNNCQYNRSIFITPNFGLCSNVFNYLDVDDTQVMFASFPKWSGSYGYPIEGIGADYGNTRNKYVNSDRKELLEHCIELMEQFVEEKSNVN